MAVVLLHNQESGQLNPTFRSQPLKIEPVQLVFFFDSPNSHSSTTVTVHNISDSHHPFDFILPRSGCFKLDLPPRVGLQSGDSREFKLTYAAHGMQIEDDLLEIQCETFSYRIPMHCFPVYTNTLFPPVISFSDRKPGETLTRLYRFESAHSIEYPFVIDTKDLDSHVTVTPTSGIIPSSGGVECTITLVCDDTLPASGNLGKFIMKGNAIRQRTTLLECPADHTAARHTSTIPASFIMNRPSHRSITSRASYTQSTSFSKTSRNPSDSSRDHSKSFSFSLSFDSSGESVRALEGQEEAEPRLVSQIPPTERKREERIVLVHSESVAASPHTLHRPQHVGKRELTPLVGASLADPVLVCVLRHVLVALFDSPHHADWRLLSHLLLNSDTLAVLPEHWRLVLIHSDDQPRLVILHITKHSPLVHYTLPRAVRIIAEPHIVVAGLKHPAEHDSVPLVINKQRVLAQTKPHQLQHDVLYFIAISPQHLSPHVTHNTHVTHINALLLHFQHNA
ncbi:hypothetical protein BLNAU_3696 [Blattamonas nauphoetae]|uniref:MSP domain-containing protein n=1 Tax=Blattamonas nauphoetae TaxID=2049346 RepID=A0ABQ9YC24_9EUKA|nr:hypothetical protein BLNAU_3696 [Blattamonas nauphoetae]